MSEYVYLAHHGTKGMHWGDRKYQNPDGSLTPLGRVHYGVGQARKAAGTVGGVVKKGASATGRAVGKTAKRVADYNSKENRAQRRQQQIQALEEKKRIQQLKKETSVTGRIKQAEADRKQARLEKAADKATTKRKLSRREIKSLSNEELNARVQRLEQERKLVGLENTMRQGTVSKSAGTVAKWVSGAVGKSTKKWVEAQIPKWGTALIKELSSDQSTKKGEAFMNPEPIPAKDVNVEPVYEYPQIESGSNRKKK